MAFEELFQFTLLGSRWEVLDQNDRIAPFAGSAGVSVQRVEVNHLQLLEPLFCLVEDDGLGLGHLDSHAALLVAV